MSGQPKKKLHSSDYFGEARDFWWNLDFLQLMGQRWQVENVNTVLDVGCGQGHWGQVLSQILPVHTTLVGIDQEPKWVEEAERRAQDLGLDKRFSYEQGNADALPSPDCQFDLVTCQTVLIHMADPVKVLGEMMRVLKPGGLLVVAEPNNLAGVLMFSSLSTEGSIEQICQDVECHATCERGKISLGEGNSSLGDLVPGYFAKLGLQNIQTYISDKASPLFPPYSSKEQQVSKQLYLDWFERGRWSRAESLRYFLAGGGTEQGFEAYWVQMLRKNKSVEQSLLKEEFYTSGGAVMYLVSGRKSNKS
ncbi:class I SAM-dependent methyltransferase [Acaryochloris sp. CCMEE 5410]|uniref:class I SAM-dependent methyltransferase n=1 Tax=Acaryochloris sp. CCMEE 5410 TaxID=310037 RepID=UPI0002485094|nr:class I SAM-dependent methyltransferase [Acaryochloris sp. CCMEE 5410]KAI9129251.1 class I SAM-dependent methyltransferase [Acaryochloris sp. CCMEE 5410]